MSNAQMFELSEERERDENAARQTVHRRTQYVVKLTSGLYASENWHWTADVAQAKRFEFMTTANAHAVLNLELEPSQYDVEAV